MSYSDEYDPERIRQLTEQGSRDIDWLLKKVAAYCIVVAREPQITDYNGYINK